MATPIKKTMPVIPISVRMKYPAFAPAEISLPRIEMKYTRRLNPKPNMKEAVSIMPKS